MLSQHRCVGLDPAYIMGWHLSLEVSVLDCWSILFHAIIFREHYKTWKGFLENHLEFSVFTCPYFTWLN